MSSTPPPPSGTPPLGRPSFAHPCDPIINEIVKTEETYLHDLGLICANFLRPCLEKKIISPEDTALVFANMERLLLLHEVVVVDLRSESTKEPANQNWGQVFKLHEARFRSE